VFRSGFYLPQVLPVAVTDTVGLSWLSRTWLGDPKYALYSVMAVMVWFQLRYPVVMFMSGLQRIEPELYEAADLDGAGWWRRFRHITVHLIRPEFSVMLVNTTIAALKIFGQIFVLTRGEPSNATLVVLA